MTSPACGRVKASAIGPLAGLVTKRESYENAVRTLGDAATTLLVLVARPDAGALQEAARTAGELAGEGIDNQWLVVNGRFTAQGNDPLAQETPARGWWEGLVVLAAIGVFV